jgi:phage regulator Rha-like protein
VNHITDTSPTRHHQAEQRIPLIGGIHQPLTAHALALALVIHKDEPRIDTRMMAPTLGVKHRSLFALVLAHKDDFAELGKVRFQIASLPSGQSEKFALLNEDQAYLLLTFTRNTAKVRALKVKLVKAFGEARRAAQTHGAEYLPTYHALHDQIHALAGGSPNERFVHMNVNKLVNKVAGIEAGQRARADIPQQSLLIVAQAVAAQAIGRAPDHRAGYQQAKAALLELSRLAMLEGGTP